jgi:hypothetical protein
MVSSKYKRLRIERFLVWSTVFFCSANVFAGVGGQSPAGRLFLAQASAEPHCHKSKIGILYERIRNITLYVGRFHHDSLQVCEKRWARGARSGVVGLPWKGLQWTRQATRCWKSCTKKTPPSLMLASTRPGAALNPFTQRRSVPHTTTRLGCKTLSFHHIPLARVRCCVPMVGRWGVELRPTECSVPDTSWHSALQLVCAVQCTFGAGGARLHSCSKNAIPLFQSIAQHTHASSHRLDALLSLHTHHRFANTIIQGSSIADSLEQLSSGIARLEAELHSQVCVGCEECCWPFQQIIFWRGHKNDLLSSIG